MKYSRELIARIDAMMLLKPTSKFVQTVVARNIMNRRKTTALYDRNISRYMAKVTDVTFHYMLTLVEIKHPQMLKCIWEFYVKMCFYIMACPVAYGETAAGKRLFVQVMNECNVFDKEIEDFAI